MNDIMKNYENSLACRYRTTKIEKQTNKQT